MGLRSLLLASVACVALLTDSAATVAAASHPPTVFERVANDLAARAAVKQLPGKTKPLKAPTGPKLPKLAPVGRMFVTGVSSGGCMASQLHVAYSSMINGAGIFAAGPWGCAEGNLERALEACMDDVQPIGFDGLLDAAVEAQSIGTIDSLSNLAGSPVWLFHGDSDATVKGHATDATSQWYLNFGANVLYNNASNANHAWVSPLGANACSVSASPYTSRCGDYDAQFDMLSHLLQRTPNPANTGNLLGQLSEFSQDYYTAARWGLDAQMLSMDSTGYIYVPPSCAAGSTETCDIVMVLHGCEQSVSIVGKDLIEQAYMNQYADTNRLIILYPQTIALELDEIYNPKGCWDWWAYLANDEFYSNHGGYQIETLMDMFRSIQNGSTSA